MSMTAGDTRMMTHAEFLAVGSAFGYPLGCSEGVGE
jgi:hypothetical protein